MGIRYFGISIDQQDYERVAAGPCPTCATRSHPRDLEYGEPERATLDLDKSWSYLQHIFESTGHIGALSLVAGDVTHKYDGWISHQGVVAPDRMEMVAGDIASVSLDTVRNHFLFDGEWKDDRAEGDCRYVIENLKTAIEFARDVSDQGRGVVYYIG